jgi:hypothetical protein
MTGVLVLDSGPLGLLFQKPGVRAADDCRDWLKRHIAAGVRVIVPEIADYELRRELLRIGLTTAISALDVFNAAIPGRYLPITTAAMRAAAQLWADIRRAGIPTADRHALDGDVILAAQILSAGFQPQDFVVATTNPVHLARLVPAQDWATI